MRYEDHVRHNLPALLEHHCGLAIPIGVKDLQRQELGGQEWDFRAPVRVVGAAPGAAAKADDFVIFPSKPAYSQPPERLARQLTPTRFGGMAAPPLAHYLSIFEITTKSDWTNPTRTRPGMLERLEKRLLITYDRARSTYPDASISSITDIVAVVGVVAPTPYTASVRSAMEREPCPFAKLKEMMDAGRFVFICVPLTAISSPRELGAARLASNTASAVLEGAGVATGKPGDEGSKEASKAKKNRKGPWWFHRKGGGAGRRGGGAGGMGGSAPAAGR